MSSNQKGQEIDPPFFSSFRSLGMFPNTFRSIINIKPYGTRKELGNRWKSKCLYVCGNEWPNHLHNNDDFIIATVRGGRG